VPHLIRDLKDQDPAVRGAATQSLTDLRDPRCLPLLLQAWKQSDVDAVLRKQLVITLGNFQNPQAVDALVEAIGDASRHTGSIAARELLGLGPAAQQKLVDALLDPKRHENASDALATNPGLAVDLLSPRLKDSKLEDSRVAIIDALVNSAIKNLDEGRSSEIPGLIYAAASDSSPLVRAAVASAIQEFADSNHWLDDKGYGAPGYDIDKARPALECLANDADADVRTASMWALGSIGDGPALITLRKHLDDPDPQVQDMASRQLSAHSALEVPAPSPNSSSVQATKPKPGEKESPSDTIDQIRTMNESDIPRLIRYLKHSNSLVRAAAADQLGKIDYREHNRKGGDDKRQDLSEVEPLINALGDTHSLVRAAAVESLAAIGDPRSVDPLIDLFRDPKPKVVLATEKALADLTGTTEDSNDEENAIQIAGLEPAVADAVTALLTNTDPEIRHAAYDLLSRVATPEQAGLLLAAVDDADTTVRPLAINGLTHVLIYRSIAVQDEDFDKAAGKAFAKKLDDPSCRDAALSGLTALKTVPPEAVPPLIQIALETYRAPQFTWHTQFAVAELLKNSRDPRAIAPLITILLHSGDINSGASVAEALGDLADPSAIEPLLHALEAPNYKVRYAATSAIAKFQDPRIVPALIHSLADPEPGVRYQAATSLGSFKDPRIVPALIHSLTDEASNVQSAVAHSLARIGDTSAVEPLKHVAPHSAGAIAALGEFKTPDAVDFLVATLLDNASKMRQDAAEALGNAADTRAVPALIQAMLAAELDKPPSQLAGKCAEALGKLKDPRAIKPLQEVARKNPWAQPAATSALFRLGASPQQQ
jgi:HEAT repeat protein